MRHIIKSFIILCLLIITSVGLAANFSGSKLAPEPTNDIKALVTSDNGQYWMNINIKLTNVSNHEVDFRDASIVFQTPVIVNSIYGNFAPLSWPSRATLTATAQASGFLINYILGFDEGSWVTTKLPAGKSITLSFGIDRHGKTVDLAAIQSSVKVYLNGTPPALEGSIVIMAPKMPGSDAGTKAKATVTCSDNQAKNVELNWGESTTLTALPYGNCVVHTNQVGDYPGGADQNITLSKEAKSATVSLSYLPKVTKATLAIQMPASPVTGAPQPIVMLQDITLQTAAQSIIANWGSTQNVDLTQDHLYRAWLPNFQFNGSEYISNYSQAVPFQFTANSTTPTVLKALYTVKPIPNISATIQLNGLPSGAEVSTTLTGIGSNTYNFKLHAGSNEIKVVAGQYNIAIDTFQADGKSYSANLNNPYTVVAASNLVISFTENTVTSDKGKIYYHLTFPVSTTSQTENLPLTENYKDLIMSNYVAGGLFIHLLKEHFPNLQFNHEYIAGSIFGQLLQENLGTSDYIASQNWINPDPIIRNMLLSPGQGGPYQLNDYSKRLEHKIGMINFTVLQKSLGYTIEDQDSGAQTGRKGPATLDDKYFGPVAATYFQYNDLLRLQGINQDPWGPGSKWFAACMKNLEVIPNNILDMILNATYNAGPWANITNTYLEICANYNNPVYADRLNNINNYTLTDAQYRTAIGTNEAIGSTFILYPRQIRFYADQLFNYPTVLGTNNALIFQVPKFRAVFASVMGTLAYVNKAGKYDYIAMTDSNNAFDSALLSLNISASQNLNISNKDDRVKIFHLLEKSIANLSQSLGITFSEVTETNHRTQ